MVGKSTSTLSERFFAKFEIGEPDECWNWLGSRDKGYGKISDGVTEGGHPRPRGAHRVSYEIHKGPIPPGLLVMHSCDNPACVNPAHLSLGTVKDNGIDMARKGRSAGTKRRNSTTECKYGHPFTAENTYVFKRDNRHERHCIECGRRRARLHYHKKRAMVAQQGA